MNKNIHSVWKMIGRQALAAFMLALAALLLWGVFSDYSARPAFTSAEVKFTDASPDGLAIVPASCPSPPYTEDYPGQCGTNSPVCADGTPAPNGDPTQCPENVGSLGGGCQTGYTLQGGQCVFVACPLWYIQEGSQCVLQGCPPDYSLENGQCIVTSCPSNYTLQDGQCVFVQCPAGQTVQNGNCVAYGSCVADTECIGQNLYSRAASCVATLVQTCPYGCANSACIIPPASIATWNVQPTLVRSGSTVAVSWAAQNVTSCSVTGSNGDGTGNNYTGTWGSASGSKTSSPIITQTVYTITCQALPGSTPASVSESTTVNIVPIFQEI